MLSKDQYKSKVLPFSFIIRKKECHFTNLIQDREEYMRSIKLNWRRRTIIFIVNCKQKLIIIIRMRDELINWNKNISDMSKKFRILIGK